MHQLRIFFMAISIAFLPAQSVFSQNEPTSQFVEGSYIITFKDSAGLVEPPNEANRGKVAVGEPTSGQSREALATLMGLKGEITTILESMNAIIVTMDATEAERWRQDERVLGVDQSMLGTLLAENEPVS